LARCFADGAVTDVYVLLITQRYGYRSPENNPQQPSIIQLEYWEASRHGFIAMQTPRTGKPSAPKPRATNEFYADNKQGELFGDTSRIKSANEEQILSYIKKRMQTVFAGISNFAILRNSMGYPMFALLMGVTNPSTRAISSALRISNHLIDNLNH
jgi:hypothetical protein